MSPASTGHPRAPLRRAAPALAVALAAAAGPVPVRAAEGAAAAQPGAYCRIPETGEEAKCLIPAQARYADLFRTLEEGGDVAAAAGPVESDLASRGDDATLALSSLAYAYWRLALRAAETQTVDPEVAETLEEWNRLLARVYQSSEPDSSLREAVQDAARDLERRTASQGFRPAEGLPEQLGRVEDQLGVRGAVKRVLHKVFPEHPEPAPATAPAEAE